MHAVRQCIAFMARAGAGGGEAGAARAGARGAGGVAAKSVGGRGNAGGSWRACSARGPGGVAYRAACPPLTAMSSWPLVGCKPSSGLSGRGGAGSFDVQGSRCSSSQPVLEDSGVIDATNETRGKGRGAKSNELKMNTAFQCQLTADAFFKVTLPHTAGSLTTGLYSA